MFNCKRKFSSVPTSRTPLASRGAALWPRNNIEYLGTWGKAYCQSWAVVLNIQCLGEAFYSFS